jgi:RNA polymerase sigma factor (sigma-70 family)
MATTAQSFRPAALRPAALVGDEGLARRVARGDDGAFEELYRRYQPRLHRYCASVLGDAHEAEEALQSTMFAAYRALRDRPTRSLHLRAWLYRVAHNHCVDILRRRRSADELSELEEEPGLAVDERVVVLEDVRQLRRDLAALAPDQRAALLLREMSGLSHAEIAEALEATPAAAKQLIHDARRGLAAFATGRDLPCDDVQRRISERDGRVLRGGAIRGHLRACPDCARYRESIEDRRARLGCWVLPLSPLAAKGILAGVLGGGGAASAAVGAGVAVKLAAAGVATIAAAAAITLPLLPADAGAEPARPTAPEATAAAPAPHARAAVTVRAARAPQRSAPARRPRPADPVPAEAPPQRIAPPEAPPRAPVGSPDPSPAPVAAGVEAAGVDAGLAASVGPSGLGASAHAGPAAASAGVDASVAAPSASVSAQTPVASASVGVSDTGASVALDVPGVAGVRVTLPPLLAR